MGRRKGRGEKTQEEKEVDREEREAKEVNNMAVAMVEEDTSTATIAAYVDDAVKRLNQSTMTRPFPGVLDGALLELHTRSLRALDPLTGLSIRGPICTCVTEEGIVPITEAEKSDIGVSTPHLGAGGAREYKLSCTSLFVVNRCWNIFRTHHGVQREMVSVFIPRPRDINDLVACVPPEESVALAFHQSRDAHADNGDNWALQAASWTDRRTAALVERAKGPGQVLQWRSYSYAPPDSEAQPHPVPSILFLRAVVDFRRAAARFFPDEEPERALDAAENDYRMQLTKLCYADLALYLAKAGACNSAAEADAVPEIAAMWARHAAARNGDERDASLASVALNLEPKPARIDDVD